MNFSIITASFPIDDETYKEIKLLCDEAFVIDKYNYCPVLNLTESQKADARGFFVLAYDDEHDKLVGVANATDQMGLNTYEWSILVAPMYREIGIDEALLKVVGDGLHHRGAEGELALVIENDTSRRKFVEKYGYSYSFSEATFETKPEATVLCDRIFIRPYIEMTDEDNMIEILGEAFGDLREESVELISYNTSTEGRIMWVAILDDEIAGTVTSVKEGDIQWVTALAVHPDYQGQGVATVLLNWVKDFALRSGEKIVMLEVEVENERALAVYEKAGFIKSMQVDYFVYTGE